MPRWMRLVLPLAMVLIASGPARAGAAGVAGADEAPGAAPAAARPGNRTGVWHFGHFTLNGRSGARASSMTMR